VSLSPKHRKLVLVGSVVAMVAAGSLFATLASAASNPRGNNGTVKVDDTPFDDHPNNEPHVGCTFQVDFYGFDEGDDLNADVTFEAHPPTGPVQTLAQDTVPIGGNDNSGGGSEAGLDASREYTLDLSGIEPHPKQGVHVKLTVNADGSQGADTKHKVFWVTGCPPAPTTTTTVPPTTVPDTTVPPTTVPDSTVPDSTVPDTTVPDTTVPDSTVPDTTVPDTTVPDSTVPDSTVPEPTEPSNSTPTP
jgi:hypothetical protein